jgi:hypothetical protein
MVTDTIWLPLRVSIICGLSIVVSPLKLANMIVDKLKFIRLIIDIFSNSVKFGA